MQNNYIWSDITEVHKGIKQISTGEGKVIGSSPTKDIFQQLETLQLSQLEEGSYWHIVATS